ncbi:adenylyl-sulfate kinase [Pseudomonas meliae]|nr:adenylyl-sulfate kinase [Pseudomonas meliae]
MFSRLLAENSCLARSFPKGLYRRALAGELKDFTGISAPYELPAGAALCLDTSQLSMDDCLERVLRLLSLNT